MRLTLTLVILIILNKSVASLYKIKLYDWPRLYKTTPIQAMQADSLADQPLRKRGRVWSTSHREFMLQSQQWASTTMCDQ